MQVSTHIHRQNGKAVRYPSDETYSSLNSSGLKGYNHGKLYTTEGRITTSAETHMFQSDHVVNKESLYKSIYSDQNQRYLRHLLLLNSAYPYTNRKNDHLFETTMGKQQRCRMLT